MKEEQIKSTTDYKMFKKHSCNRLVIDSHVNMLMKSISTHNLLEYRPIIVNSEMEIIDGQHRLEAAWKLGVPIFYLVRRDLEITKDILVLNAAQKAWSNEDFLNYYVGTRVASYLRLKEYMQEKTLPLRVALTVLGRTLGGDTSVNFKNGNFQFPEAEELQECEERYSEVKKVIEYITLKTVGPKMHLHGPVFFRALISFFNIKTIVFQDFMVRLPYRMDQIRPCARVTEYTKIFRDIYNYKNRDPLSFEQVGLDPNKF